VIDLWLDDIRPAPWGWVPVKTVEEAKKHLLTGLVRRASLDHDLGACEVCLAGRSAEQWLDESKFQSMPNCEHYQTGYTLVSWMEEHNIWPQEKPTVHSANPVGRKNMQVVINKEWERRERQS
jgi:hypothetical protein